MIFSKKTGLKIAFVLFTVSIFIACKKDTQDDNSALLQKLQGKWNFANFVTNEYYSKSDHFSTVSASPGDYMDFEPAGKLYVRLFASADTSKYTIVPNNRIVFDFSDTLDIRTITETQLVLYNKKQYSAESYYEQTYNLQR